MRYQSVHERYSVVFFIAVLIIGIAAPAVSASDIGQLELTAPGMAYEGRPVSILVKAIGTDGLIDTTYSGSAIVTTSLGALATGDAAFTDLAQAGDTSTATAEIRNGVGSVVLTGVPAANTATVSVTSGGVAQDVLITFYPATATRYRFFDRDDEWGLPMDHETRYTTDGYWHWSIDLRALTDLGDIDSAYESQAYITIYEENPDGSAGVIGSDGLDSPVDFVSGRAKPYIGDTEPEDVTFIAGGDLASSQVLITYEDNVVDPPPTGKTVSGQISTWDATTGSECGIWLYTSDTVDFLQGNAAYSTGQKTGGTYTIPYVADGSYILIAKAPGYLQFQAPVTVSSADVVQDILLGQGASVSGSVSPAGTIGWVVVKDAMSHYTVASSAFEGADETSYRISGLSAGTYDLFFYQGDDTYGKMPDSCAYLRITLSGEEQITGQDMAFEPLGSISGVVDTSMSSLTVRLYPAGERDAYIKQLYIYEEEDFSLSDIPAGIYDLMANLYGYPDPVPLSLNILVSAGQTTTQDLYFHPNLGSLEVLVETDDAVFDETGEIRLFKKGTVDLRSGYPMMPYYSGAFSTGAPSTISDIYPGEYDLWVMAESNSLPYVRIPITIPDSGEGPVVQAVTLARGPVSRIMGTVTRKDNGNPQPFTAVALVRERMVYGMGNTDDTGVFRIMHVPRGTYDIWVFKGGAHWMMGEMDWELAGIHVAGQLVINEGAQVGGLHFEIEPKGTVTLTSPKENLSITGNSPTFSWEAYPGAQSYLLVITERVGNVNASWDPFNFSWGWEPPSFIREITGTGYTLGSADGISHQGENFTLKPCRPYAWQVYALPAPYDPISLAAEGFAGEIEAIAVSSFGTFWTGEIGAACPESLIPNPGFEDVANPPADFWAFHPNADAEDITIDSSVSASGQNSLMLHTDPTGANWAASQVMAFQDLGIQLQNTPDLSYNLTARVARDQNAPGAGGDAIRFELVFTDAAGQHNVTILAGDPSQAADGAFHTLSGSVLLPDLISIDRLNIVKTGSGIFRVDCLELYSQAVPLYAVSGLVTGTGNGMPGVTVTLTGVALSAPMDDITAGDGSYRFDNLPLGSYTVTPGFAGYEFDPVSATLTLYDTDVAQNFSGSVPKAVLSGTVKTGAPGYNVGILGALVTVEGDGGTFTTTTAQDGTWQIAAVPYGSYTVTVGAADHQSQTLTGINIDSAIEIITDGNFALPVTAACGANPWDANANGRIDLSDVINGLQVITGIGSNPNDDGPM